MNTIEMEITKTPVIKMNLTNNDKTAGFDVQAYRGTKDHAELKHLDYDLSGHTGFQPAGNYPDESLTNMDIENLLRNFN